METRAEAARRSRLRRIYNITPEEYTEILVFQGGVCPICLEKQNAKGEPKKLGVDHQHKSGLIRGVLCFYCNRKLPEWFTLERTERIVEYLKNPPATQALGEERFGKRGRVDNKRKRKAARRRTSKKNV